ncbi:MAG: glutamine--fructose-6-phosphate transaminase (isomerizing) [Candidatus Izemoplasmataceae bacterium]
MCGIVGYIGDKNAQNIVMDGLRRLEYRGYDSAGITLFDPNKNEHLIIKRKGRIKTLEKDLPTLMAPVAMGHTRWATHGRVSEENAHPHTSSSGRFVVVHNGVVDNHTELRKLYLQDTDFQSQTDSEVIVELIDHFSRTMPVESALRRTLSLLNGSYALLVMDMEDPWTLWGAKFKSPLLLGKGNEGMVIGSDMMALIDAADNYLALDDETIVRIDKKNFTVYNLSGEVLPYKLSPLELDHFDTDKGEFEHYMLKEIHEQPAVIRRIIGEYFNETHIRIDEGLIEGIAQKDRIYILAAGTSMHAGLVGKTIMERLTDLPVEVHVASEFAYDMPKLTKNPQFILISQSGETADLRACLVNIKKTGHPTLTLTNVTTSTLAREADACLSIHAGPEIAVASTKAYTAQIAVLAILAYALSAQSFDLKRELSEVAIAMENFLSQAHGLEEKVKSLLTKRNAFYIGRGLDYKVCMEAALKLKEISYIQTEGFPAGELKHGTIALIEEDTPVIAIISSAKTSENTRSNLSEVESRGAKTFVVSLEGVARDDDGVILDDVNPLLSPLLTVIPTQLIAYYAALHRDLDIDKPRNLAKSVTVE